MSANNWRVCPQCKARKEAERHAKLAAASKAYGKVPEGDWLKMVEEANRTPDRDKDDLEESLREDWSLGTDADGEFHVSYRAGCERCGFEHRFQHSEKVKLEKR